MLQVNRNIMINKDLNRDESKYMFKLNDKETAGLKQAIGSVYQWKMLDPGVFINTSTPNTTAPEERIKVYLDKDSKWKIYDQQEKIFKGTEEGYDDIHEAIEEAEAVLYSFSMEEEK